MNYLNKTGPGDYNSSPMTGWYIQDSRKTNQPAFTMRGRYEESRLPIISKQHLQHTGYGKASPGVGTYNLEQKASKNRAAGNQFASTKRFQEIKEIKLMSEVPVGYVAATSRHSKTGSKIGFEKWFAKDNPLYLTTESPGPGNYNLSTFKSVTTRKDPYHVNKVFKKVNLSPSNSIAEPHEPLRQFLISVPWARRVHNGEMECDEFRPKIYLFTSLERAQSEG